MHWSTFFPSASLSPELTEESVCGLLNTRNCFASNHRILEGDSLTIRPDKEWQGYLSFVYRSGKWTADYYTGYDRVQAVAAGWVDLTENCP